MKSYYGGPGGAGESGQAAHKTYGGLGDTLPSWETGFYYISNWDNCPKYENTNRQFECHTSITPEQVFNKIKDWI